MAIVGLTNIEIMTGPILLLYFEFGLWAAKIVLNALEGKTLKRFLIRKVLAHNLWIFCDGGLVEMSKLGLTKLVAWLSAIHLNIS